ncbi:hypothetical protein ACV1DG_24480, partial [Aeromonas hydrophila]
GVFGDSQFTSTLSVNFHFPKIPRRTFFYAPNPGGRHQPMVTLHEHLMGFVWSQRTNLGIKLGRHI